MSSSDVAESFQKPSTSTGPPEGPAVSDMATGTQDFKQECDSLGIQITPIPSKSSKASPSFYSSSSSSSPSPSSSSTQRPSQSTQCSRSHKPRRVSPRTVILSRAAYSLLAGESGSQLSSFSLLPHADMSWSSPLRPPITHNLQGAELSTHYRQWTTARQHHADYEAPPVPHPRRLLLSGPPQVKEHTVTNLTSTNLHVITEHSRLFDDKVHVTSFTLLKIRSMTWNYKSVNIHFHVTVVMFWSFTRSVKPVPTWSSFVSCFECSSVCWRWMCMTRRKKPRVRIIQGNILHVVFFFFTVQSLIDSCIC